MGMAPMAFSMSWAEVSWRLSGVAAEVVWQENGRPYHANYAGETDLACSSHQDIEYGTG